MEERSRRSLSIKRETINTPSGRFVARHTRVPFWTRAASWLEEAADRIAIQSLLRYTDQIPRRKRNPGSFGPDVSNRSSAFGVRLDCLIDTRPRANIRDEPDGVRDDKAREQQPPVVETRCHVCVHRTNVKDCGATALSA